jgi:hypothetical protein
MTLSFGSFTNSMTFLPPTFNGDVQHMFLMSLRPRTCQFFQDPTNIYILGVVVLGNLHIALISSLLGMIINRHSNFDSINQWSLRGANPRQDPS